MSDTSLTTAAQEAVGEEVEEAIETEEVNEDIIEDEEVEDAIETEEIPTDHKERSNLGRKISALHKRNDKLEENISKLTELIGKLVPEAQPDETDEEYVTRRDLKKIISEPQQKEKKYEEDYMSSFTEVGEGLGLDDDEIENVWGHMLENNNIRVKGDPVKDASINFMKSYRQMTEKKLPLKKGTPTGVIKRSVQKGPVKKSKMFDPATENYLKMIRNREGAEKEAAMRKELSE